MKLSKPSVTIILITWNVERTISKVLKTIEEQDYPKKLIEVIAVDGDSSDSTVQILKKSSLKIKVIRSPYPKDPEACRGVGLKKAKNEIICFIDSDNYLPHKKWLSKMIEPFMLEKNIVGSETLRFAYRKSDNILNRYFALIGSADPVGLYLGKADKISYLSDEWKLYGDVISSSKNYFLVQFAPNRFPTLGSNGFCAKRKLLLKGKSDPEHYFHIDVPLDLAKLGYTQYAVVRDVIIHDTATTLSNFLSKRAKYMRLHYQKRSSDRRYKVFDPKSNHDLFRIFLFIFFSLTLVQPTYIALKGYLAVRDRAWFMHPVFCFSIMSIYAYAVLEKFIKTKLK
ncbi:MAG: glycosyltransferase family 2 protein [Niabella sp.]|nr:MAG: glycosyltransferase family 2 protein [Niabella sp.]